MGKANPLSIRRENGENLATRSVHKTDDPPPLATEPHDQAVSVLEDSRLWLIIWDMTRKGARSDGHREGDNQ